MNQLESRNKMPFQCGSDKGTEMGLYHILQKENVPDLKVAE